MDFGLTRGVTRSSLSLTGRFVGSPHYAAPEQIRGEPESIGPQADVYALGATMYESLAGRPPFEGASTEQLFHRILSHDPTPLRKHNPALPERRDALDSCVVFADGDADDPRWPPGSSWPAWPW